MDIKYPIGTFHIKQDSEASFVNQQINVEALLEESKRKQIVLNQLKLIITAVKEAATDPTLEESVPNAVNRVLVHDAFVKIGSPYNFFSECVIEKNAAAKLSYSESVPLKEKVEKILTQNCKEIIDKFNKTKERPSTEFNADDEKIKMFLENQMELQKCDQLQREEQELYLNLIELRQKSIGSLLNAVNTLGENNRLLGLKAKVEALTFQRNLWLKEDKDLPQAVAKLAAHWKRESEKSEAAVKKAEQDREEYARLEKDESYVMLLKEYLRVVQQTNHLEIALEKL